MLQKSEHEEIIVCLFEGDFGLGTAALINSLNACKFKGLIHIGFKGDMPAWVNQIQSTGTDHYVVMKDIELRFSRVDTGMHLGYYKPYFIRQTFDSYPSTRKVFYFDTDIIARAPWSLFSKWLESGVCVCLDNAFHFVPHNHPWRKDWRNLAATDAGLFSKSNYYYNAGFLGIERSSIAIIDRWIHCTDRYIECGGNVKFFAKQSYGSFKGDQDLLNAAFSISADIEVNVMGKEAMGFTYPATMMMHAIGKKKPWNKSFIKQLVRFGQRPSIAERTFFLYAKYPLRIFSTPSYILKRLDLLIATLFGRFVG